jgi:hypothetical protein
LVEDLGNAYAAGLIHLLAALLRDQKNGKILLK